MINTLIVDGEKSTWLVKWIMGKLKGSGCVQKRWKRYRGDSFAAFWRHVLQTMEITVDYLQLQTIEKVHRSHPALSLNESQTECSLGKVLFRLETEKPQWTGDQNLKWIKRTQTSTILHYNSLSRWKEKLHRRVSVVGNEWEEQ